MRAGCKGDSALGVTSKCPLDRYVCVCVYLQLFQRFLLSRTTVAVLLVQTQQLFPKAQPPQLLALKKNPNNRSPKRQLLSQGKNVINKNITQGWDTCSLTSNWPGCPWLAYYIRPQKEKEEGGRRGESGKEQREDDSRRE